MTIKRFASPKTGLLLVAALALAACGADGQPMTPAAPEAGITVSGEARVGVSLG